MMFTSTYTSKSMNACSASVHQAEAASVCAQASTARTQSASVIARVLDTVMVSIFVAIIAILGIAILSILGILGLIRLAALVLLAVLLILGQLNSVRSDEPAEVR